MQVRVLLPAADHTFLPKNVLHRNVERDMQKLVKGARFEFAQKTAVVLDVGKYVDGHRQIEHFSFPQMIFEQGEVQPRIYSSLAQFNRLGRDVSSPQLAIGIESLLQQPENLSGAP